MEKNILKNKRFKSLFEVIANLKSPKESADFFRDLCTLEELEEMTGRWQVAELLNQGYSYRDIAAKTGLSTTTVTRVAYWLNFGRGGYRLALKRKKKSIN